MSRRFKRIVNGALVLASIFLFAFLAFPGFIVRAARYDSGKMDFVVGVEGNITITLPKTDISFMVDPSKNEIAFSVIDINVDSNLNHGVLLGMNTAYSNYAGDDTANGLNSVHNYTIKALDGTVHKSLFPANRWGYSLDDGTYYSRMPAANEAQMAEVLIENPSVTDVQQVRIGAKADISQPLDYYYTTINFTAITNLAARTIDDIIYMQDIDPEIVDGMEVGRQYRLRDVRDNKDYWIAKATDGNVWMAQNLDLDLSSDITLTPDDSDLKRRWTPSNTKKEIDYNLKDSYEFIQQGVTRYHGLVISYSNGGTSYSYKYNTNEGLYGENIDECYIKYADNPKFCNHFRTGQSYTPLEALAANKTSDILASGHNQMSLDESICPKGWRLPTGNYSNYDTRRDDFPRTNQITIREYDRYGNLITHGTLGANLRQEPYFFNSSNYYTSTVTADNALYARQANYNSLDYTTYSVSDSNTSTAKVRCMVRPSNTFTIEFNLNGGEGSVPESQKGESWGDSYIFQLNSISNYPTKEGYNLIGWSTDPNATYPEVISSGMGNNNIYNAEGKRIPASITVTQPITQLYAVWENSIKLKFDANGGKFTGSLYSGETEDEIVIAYSRPLSGTIESEVRTYSSTDCSGIRKSNINDSATYCKNNSNSASDSFGSEYDYVDLTIYYAVSGDSILCVFNNYNNYGYDRCQQSLSGNLAEGAYYEASDYYLYTENYQFTNSNNSYAISFRGGENSDGRTNWYGWWAEVKAVKNNTHVQYLRSARSSITTPTREGYRFIGWSTRPNATRPNWEYNSNMEYSEDKQLYAVWKQTPTVTINVTTNNPDRVHINNPTIIWNTSSSLSFNKNSDYQWTYYDQTLGETVVFANVTVPGDQFYLATSSISKSSFYTDFVNTLDEDTYTVTIEYTEEPLTNMHELTRESCALSPLNTTQRMTDARDNKKYWVTKLADGNCWMTQNLDFAFTKPGNTTLYPDTSAVSAQQTVYVGSSWTTNSEDNNYFDGGDYYYQNGTTPTSTSSLADNAEAWHYHKGSYYNQKLAKMVCPKGWQLGDYKNMYSKYSINQIKAALFTPVGSAPLEAPVYQIVDANTSVSKPDSSSSNRNTYTVYWSTSTYSYDLVYSNTSSTTPLSLYYVAGSALSTIKAYTNNSSEFRNAGFVRCMR